MAAKSTAIVSLATAKALPGKEAALERALREAAVPTREQPGCISFEIYRSAQDPSSITGIEHWASAADHQRHLQGDHIKTLMARFDGVLAGPPEIRILTPL